MKVILKFSTLTQCSTVLEMLIITELVKKPLNFREHEVSILSPQEPAMVVIMRQINQVHIVIPYDKFYYYSSIYA
jgi:hypothetical protein